MKEKTNTLISIVRIVLSVAVIVLSCLQLAGVMENAPLFTCPLIGATLLLSSVQEWKKHRGMAIFGLCSAAFILICSVVIWILR